MAFEDDDDREAMVQALANGETGTYTRAAGGAAVAVDVIHDRPSRVAALGDLGALTTARTAKVLRAQLAADPVAGDTLVLNGTTYTVRKPIGDQLGKIWTLELEAA